MSFVQVVHKAEAPSVQVVHKAVAEAGRHTFRCSNRPWGSAELFGKSDHSPGSLLKGMLVVRSIEPCMMIEELAASFADKAGSCWDTDCLLSLAAVARLAPVNDIAHLTRSSHNLCLACVGPATSGLAIPLGLAIPSCTAAF